MATKGEYLKDWLTMISSYLVHYLICGKASTHWTVLYAPAGRLRRLINASNIIKSRAKIYGTLIEPNKVADK
jgi:hypothetical protein